MYQRKRHFEIVEDISFFLWGARQTGKSTLLKNLFPDSLIFDLLLSNLYKRFLDHPEQFREVCIEQHNEKPIIVDEIQRLPILLNEVHWMIENKGFQFILSGSSPRKILRNGSNLLGGRALRFELFPLSYSEVDNFDLIRALNHGLIPRHYDAKNPQLLIDSYISNYLEDEIIAETKIRNVETFSKFLSKAAFANSEIVNYTNIATDCGIASVTVKEYYQILQDTLIGNYVPVFQKNPKRRIIAAPKFYFFDVGIANFLLRRNNILSGSIEFGHALEHFIFMELKCYSHYTNKKFPIYYWRTTSQIEVDFILGDHEVAIEVKAADNITSKHIKGLKAFGEEYQVNKRIIVSTDPLLRNIDNIIALPWNIFLDKLWAGEII
jgi:uncharacterized protein